MGRYPQDFANGYKTLGDNQLGDTTGRIHSNARFDHPTPSTSESTEFPANGGRANRPANRPAGIAYSRTVVTVIEEWRIVTGGQSPQGRAYSSPYPSPIRETVNPPYAHNRRPSSLPIAPEFETDGMTRREKAQSELCSIARSGDLGELRKALQNNIDINAKDARGRRPLTSAAANGNIGTLKILLEDPKIDLKVRDERQKRALVCAAESGSFEGVGLLIDAYDAHKRFDEPGSNSKKEMSHLSHHNNDAMDAGVAAARRGHADVVALICEKGTTYKADSLPFKCIQNTMLHAAAENKQQHVVDLLVKRGADFDSENRKKTF